MSSLKGRTAMVTGAGKNIGKDVALAFAKEGANVIVCDYNEDKATNARNDYMKGNMTAEEALKIIVVND